MSSPRATQGEPYFGPPPTGVHRAPPQAPPPLPYETAPYAPYPTQPAHDRPSTALAAAVIGWVLAALLFISAALLFFGATFLHDIESSGGYDGGRDVAELFIDGVLDIVAAGLLVSGGVALTSRNRHGRPLLVGGALLVLVLSLYWLVRWSGRLAGATTGYAVIFGAGALLVAAFSLTPGVTSWLAAGSG